MSGDGLNPVRACGCPCNCGSDEERSGSTAAETETLRAEVRARRHDIDVLQKSRDGHIARADDAERRIAAVEAVLDQRAGVIPTLVERDLRAALDPAADRDTPAGAG